MTCQVPIDDVADLPDALLHLFKAFDIATASRAIEVIEWWRAGQLPPPTNIPMADVDRAYAALLKATEISDANELPPVPPPGVLPPEEFRPAPRAAEFDRAIPFRPNRR